MVLEKVFYKIISTINVNTWNAHRDLVGIITLQIMIIIIIIIIIIILEIYEWWTMANF